MKCFVFPLFTGVLLVIFLLTITVASMAAEEDGYVGSETCSLCHRDIANKWKETPHANYVRETSPESVVGDFTQLLTLSDAGAGIPPVTIELGVQDNVYTVKLGDTTYTVAYAFGGLGWKQRYLTKINNSMYILPIQWNLATQEWVPYDLGDWYDTSGALKDIAKKRAWDRRCAGCHATGNIPVKVEDEFIAQFTEDSIGCEACHGPGKEHASTLDKTKIVNPRKIEDFDRQNDICGQCHLRGTSNVGTYGYPYDETADVNFRPGDDLTTMFIDGGGYWPDGTSKQHHQQWLDWKQSNHNDNPVHRVGCIDCHDMHGTSLPGNVKIDPTNNELCLSCHGDHGFEDEVAITRHTNHSFDPVGTGTSRCTECHMPFVAKSAIAYDIRSHTFKFLSPEHGIKNKMPDSCTSCHDGAKAVAMSQPQAALEFSQFCRSCHSETSEYKEWLTSAHAKSLDDFKANDHAGNTCLKCMSADGRIADRLGIPYEEVGLTVETAKETLSCAACHKHESGLENNLLASAANICAECHSRQPKVFVGTGVADVMDMPSVHSKIMSEKCVTCHMYKEGEEVVEEGGHTFKPDAKACKACHPDPEAMITAVEKDVTGLLDGLQVMLDAVPEEEKATDLYKAVNSNYGLLSRDGSAGVHNYSYAKAVLGYSYVALGATAPIANNCAVCHSESAEYKEWQTSAHAHSLETGKTSDHFGNNCLRCMGASSYLEDPEVTVETAMASISCSACHNHGTGLEHNLKEPLDGGCSICHTMGTAAPGGSPHHPQGEMFAGIGGAGVQKMPSGHNNTTPEKCATCHMYKEAEEVLAEGGHTFHPTLESCKSCHADGASIKAQAQTEVTTLLDTLKVAIDAASDAEKETDPYKEARFNYDFVSVDGSLGVHNYAYARKLLEHAYSALDVPIPTGVVAETGRFTVSLEQGLNMISLPLKPDKSYTARSFAEKLNATAVITLDQKQGRFVGFTSEHLGDGFAIEGSKGYIVNLREAMKMTFSGTMWTNAPSINTASDAATSAWAFIVSGFVYDGRYKPVAEGKYLVTVKNLRTDAISIDEIGSAGAVASTAKQSGQFAAVWVDMSRKSVVEPGDRIQITVTDATGKIVSGPMVHQVDVDDTKLAYTKVAMELGDIIPETTLLAQNYPNPFNPETWIPYQLAKAADNVTVKIFDAKGRVVRTFHLGYKDAGMYINRDRAIYWNGRNDNGESVASGIYFYSIQAGNFTSVKKMVISK